MTEQADLKLLTHRRRDLITGIVDEKGIVRVRELSEQFGVSTMTIRRDIDSLAELKLLNRVHGGAVRVERSTRSVDEPRFITKLGLQQLEKAAIAEAAVERIAPGSAIGITAGTTTFQLVEHLGTINNLTVVTNSIPVASSLSGNARSNFQIVLTGGTPTPSSAIVGPLADRSLADLHLDQLFMGVHGMGETGFTTPNLAEAQTNRSFIHSSNEVIVLADSTKWGTTGLGTIAPLDEAHVLITDDQVSGTARASLTREIGTVELVEVAAPSQ